MNTDLIYVIKFKQRLGTEHPRGGARFYLGYSEGRLEERLEEHRRGRGAALTRWAVSKGVDFDLVAVLKGDRNFERKLKKLGNTPRLIDRLERGTSKYKGSLVWGNWMDESKGA